MNNIDSIKNKNKFNALALRQKDKGWGYAFAHYIPFVAIYYAISRRTITPILYIISLHFIVSFLVGFFAAIINLDPRLVAPIYILIELILLPITTKYAINKARRYGFQYCKLDK